MKTLSTKIRPVLLVCQILTVIMPIAFIIISSIVEFQNFNAMKTFLLTFGISIRSLTIANLVLSVLITVSSFMGKNTIILSIIDTVFSAIGFILNFKLSPISSEKEISSHFGWFGSGADLLTPMVFIALSSIVALILTINGMKKGKSTDR